MASLLEDIILCNIPDEYMCVSREFVRHPNGFAAGALVINPDTGKYYIFTGTRIANVPQEYAKKFAQI